MPRPTRENRYKVSVVFVYLAITVYGSPFQNFLLTTPIFYLMHSMTVVAFIVQYSSHKQAVLNHKNLYLTTPYCIGLSAVLPSITTPIPRMVGMEIEDKTKRVWAIPVSLATTPRIVIYSLFLALLRCFSSDGYLSIRLFYSAHDAHGMTRGGFPHSDIPGSKLVDS